MTRNDQPSPAAHPDPDDPAFIGAMEEALRLQDEGALDRASFARRHPEHAEEVLRKLAFMDALVEPDVGAGHLPSTPIAAAGPSLVGRAMGDFVLEREIGRGGMGVVFAARQTSLGREVAVKLLPPAFATEGHLRERFEREAAAAAKLAHPAIVKVHAFGEDDATLFLAMEYVDGPSLAEVIAALRSHAEGGGPTYEGFLDVLGVEPSHRAGAIHGFRAYVEAIVDIARVIADALEAAHGAELVHRDVKPGNILIDRDLRPHLTDFGLVQAVGSRQITISGQMLGTPGFMAPEMVRGRETDHRADVFSLGVVLYHALTLQLPFTGESAPVVVRKVLLTDPPPLEKVDRRIPRDLSNVVMRALEKSPDRRYPSAAALRDDLHRFLRGDPVLASRVGPISRAVRRVRRRPLVATIVIFLVLALGAVAALLVLQERKRVDELRRARDLTAEAVTRAEAGHLEAALFAYREALRIDPSLDAVRARIADLEKRKREARLEATRHSALSLVMQVFRDSRLAEAAAARVAALDLGEDYAREVGMLRALTAFVQRRFDDVLAYTAEVEKLGDTAALHYLRSWVHAECREAERSRAELARARALPAESLEDFVLGAEMATRFGEEMRALEMLRIARTRWPGSPHVPFKLGILHKDRGHHDLAVEAFTTAIQLAPEHVAAHTERGFIYLALKEFDLARADFERAIELEPRSEWASAGLYDGLVASREFDRAWTLLSAALAARPGSPVLLNSRGFHYLKLRQPAQALADFRAALAAWPDHVFAHAGLARSLWQTGKRDEALRAVEDGLKRPGLPSSAKVGLLNTRAIWRWRDPRAAEADLRAALELRRKPMILANLGLLQLQSDRFADALPYFSEQMATGYHPWVARARRGYCRWMLLDLEGGMADCDAAAEEVERRGRAEKLPWIFYNRALMHLAAHGCAGALAPARRAAELGGRHAPILLGVLIRKGDDPGLTSALEIHKTCPEPYPTLSRIWLKARAGAIEEAARELETVRKSRGSVVTWPTPVPWIGLRWAADTTLSARAHALGRGALRDSLDAKALADLDLAEAGDLVRAERDVLLGTVLADRGDFEAAAPRFAGAAAVLGWNFLHVESAAALLRLGRGAEAVKVLARLHGKWNHRATVSLLLRRGVKSGDPHLDAWLRTPTRRKR